MIERTDIDRVLMTLAALTGSAGVALAAESYHRNELDLGIGGMFLLVHAPVLLLIALLPRNRLAHIAGYVLIVALILFSGDLALRGETGHAMFTMAAPIGGVGLMLGWIVLAVSAWVGWRAPSRT